MTTTRTVPTPEEYAVYNCVLNHNDYSGHGIEQVVVAEVNDLLPSILAKILSKPSTQMPEVPPKKIVEDLQVKSNQPFSVENRFALEKPVVVVSKSELESIFLPKDKMIWIRFRERFPSSGGIVHLSRVIFDDQHKQAWVYVCNQRDWLWGFGAVFFLTLSNGEWQIQKSRIVWRS